MRTEKFFPVGRYGTKSEQNKKTKLLVNSDYDAVHVRHVRMFGMCQQIPNIRDPTKPLDGMRYVWRAFATAIN